MYEKWFIALGAFCLSFSIPDIVEEYLENKEHNNLTTLCEIMNSFGSDKGSGHHNYTTLYSKLLKEWKDKEISIFELGLGTNFPDVPSNMGPQGRPGASLYGWSAYFTKAHIYGADIDRRILFQTDRIKTFYCDQRNGKEIYEMFSNEKLQNVEFDVIIEDGLHDFNANLTFLENSIYKLKKGGVFIVEDLLPATKASFEAILPYLQNKFDLNCARVLVVPSDINWADNTLLIIQK